MASVISHFVIGATIALPFTATPVIRNTVRPIWVILAAGFVAAIPDLDTFLFSVIPYAHFLGHRGFFHSPFFAILFAGFLSGVYYAVCYKVECRTLLLFFTLSTVAMASHGILDAMTDAGLGVMLLYPLSEERFFLPWRPFYAPPIRMSDISLNHVRLMFNSELPILIVCSVFAVVIRVVNNRNGSSKNS